MTHPFDSTLGVPVCRNNTSARAEALRDIGHRGPVRTVSTGVIRICGTPSLFVQLSTSLKLTSLDLCRHAGFDYSNRLIRLQPALT